MYITAQRVTPDNGRSSGVNVYYHQHAAPLAPNSEWGNTEVDHVAYENPGELISSRVEVPAGGNTVLSYLDVVADNAASAGDIRAALNDFGTQIGSDEIPMARVIRGIAIRLGAVIGLTGAEDSEFSALRRAVDKVLSDRERLAG